MEFAKEMELLLEDERRIERELSARIQIHKVKLKHSKGNRYRQIVSEKRVFENKYVCSETLKMSRQKRV